MSNLLIEIGNTALKASWSEGMTLGKTFRYQGEKVIDYILSLVSREKPEVMVVACAYDLSDSDTGKLRKECSTLMVLDNSHPSILKKSGLPSWLTYDRVASIMAARWLFKGRGCTVFDIGTTMTVDFTDTEGKYLGGNISLGLRTRFKSLNRYSRNLPLVDTPSDDTQTISYPKSLNDAPVGSFTGNSVKSSIEAGVLSGIMFELEGYSCIHPENIIVFTGGDADYFAKRMKNSIFVVSNLVLMGLALIANDYNEKSNT